VVIFSDNVGDVSNHRESEIIYAASRDAGRRITRRLW